MESRCHAVEAVLGILLGLPDQRAVSLLTELAEDPYLRSVILQVNASAFGPRNWPALSAQEPSSSSESKEATEYPDPFVHGPTNAWQDAALRKIKANTSGASADVEPFYEGLTEDPTTPTTIADETLVGVRDASTPPRT